MNGCCRLGHLLFSLKHIIRASAVTHHSFYCVTICCNASGDGECCGLTWRFNQIQLFAHSPTHSGMERRKNKQPEVELAGWDENYWLRQKKEDERGMIVMLIIQSASSIFPTSRHSMGWYGISLWPVYVRYSGSIPSQLLVQLNLLHRQYTTKSWDTEMIFALYSTTKQQLKTLACNQHSFSPKAKTYYHSR